jgi:hypothetical protein
MSETDECRRSSSQAPVYSYEIQPWLVESWLKVPGETLAQVHN